MKPEDPLQHLQVSVTCPTPEPDKSSPCTPIPLPEDPSWYYPHIYPRLFQLVSYQPGSPPKPFMHLFSPTRDTCPTHLIFLDLINRIQFGEEYKPLSSSLCIFLHSPCYVVPLRSKYSPQDPILKRSQTTFLPQCERRRFTPIKNNRQNYISVYLLTLHFWIADWKTKDSAPNDSKHSLTSVCS